MLKKVSSFCQSRRTIAWTVGILTLLNIVSLGVVLESRKYALSPVAKEIVGKIDAELAAKYEHDRADKSFKFNASIAQSLKSDDKIAQVGGGGKDSNTLYSAKLPADSNRGIEIYDAINKFDVRMTPLFDTKKGKLKDGKVIYPLKDAPGQLVYSVKPEGLKEDILIHREVGDKLQFDFKLEIPDYMEARLLKDGSLGIYSADQALFGNITFASDVDRERVEQARANAPKNHLAFVVPAPVIIQAGGGKGIKPTSRFELNGNILSLKSAGLKDAEYPLSIDPSFLVTSAADFNTGTGEDNIDFSTPGEIGRAVLSGGSVGNWAATTALPATGLYSAGAVAYNGYIYLVGGGAGGSTNCYFVSVGGTGVLGTWAPCANTFTNARTASAVVAYNGYLYVIGGEAGQQGNIKFDDVQFAKVQPNGDLGVWALTTAFPTARSGHRAEVYNDTLYVMGGFTAKNFGAPTNAVNYARVNADGTIATWGSTQSFTNARGGFGSAVYNGKIYAFGGISGTTVFTDVQYAYINTDGTLTAWVATSSYNGAGRRDFGYAVVNGHLYLYGGCFDNFSCNAHTANAQYAVIHADGTLSPWSDTSLLPQSKFRFGGVAYNGYVYALGGCLSEPNGGVSCNSETTNSDYTKVDLPGGTTPLASTTSLSSARAYAATIAHNGYIYSVGGCTATNCGTVTNQVIYAAVNSNGTIGAWNTTTVLPAGLYGAGISAYNQRIYVTGGHNGTSTVNTVYASGIISATGSIPSWSASASTFTTGRVFHGSASHKNYIYVVGGRSGASTYLNDIQFAPISNVDGTVGAWTATTSTFTNSREAMGAVAYYGNLYVIGGNNGATHYNDVQRAKIDNTGNITTAFASDAAFTNPRRNLRAFGHNGYLYISGGNNGGTMYGDTQYAKLTGTTGTILSWETNKHNLTTARTGHASTAYNGYLYSIGGCTTAFPCTSLLATSEFGRINHGGTGSATGNPGNFTPLTDGSQARGDYAYFSNADRMYVIGGCKKYSSTASSGYAGADDCIEYYADFESAQLGVSGASSSWVVYPGLPEGRAHSAAATSKGFVYVAGGSVLGTAHTSKVIYAAVNQNGTLGAWQTTVSLPAGRRLHSMSSNGEYIYVVGGEAAGPTRLNSVLYAKTLDEGGLAVDSGCGTTWCTTAAFEGARYRHTAINNNGYLYVIGGRDTGFYTDIQYAKYNADGTLGAWSYTTDIDYGLVSRGVVAVNGYMYFMGNERYQQQVLYAPINANGTLGSINKLPINMTYVHYASGAVSVNGYIVPLHGCTDINCVTIDKRVERGGQHAVVRSGHYSKLFDTIVDTAPTKIIANGTRASGSSYISLEYKTATSSQPQFGLSNFISPMDFGKYYNFFAVDGAGNPTGIAKSYYVFFTLDDTGSGAFPDENISGNKTTLTDFELFYRANPGRRMRHGKSFSDTACSTNTQLYCELDTAPIN